ncbi:mannitol dehydrogenase family protein [Pseudooceanicola sp. MF1-13]|uniref:mannitol dehydrogenase family protein n=1 Tax=Pseudooceanicola sp. MF1-13 TaxID=3379095 RepID=UPI0038916AA9
MDELTQKDTALPLSDASLTQLPTQIQTPRYDRQAVTPGIVHIGVGNFHRAHQAWYLHRLMQDGKALDWGIIGAGVRAFDDQQRQKLAAQDFLTTLIELDPAGTSAEVVGSMIGFIPVTDGHGPLITQMSDPAIRIVSLTVTEGGYYLDPATKRFDANDDDIRHDAANLTAPRTAFGAIVAALRARRDAGLGPFTVQSCDNLPGNGRVTRDVVVGLGHLADADLGAWIDENVSFPNAMVDCIVPATGQRELGLARQFGIADAAPVTHENFRQWVIEDAFCAGRPPWEEVRVTISDKVHAYEAMKLRLLNGGHQVIAAPAEILGLTTIAETMEHDGIRAMFRKVALEEIAPHVAEVPGMTPAAYVDLIDRRFSNPAIHDTVRRVAFDGSSRHSGAVFPVIRDAIAAGAPLDGLALSQALWCRMCQGTREDGSQIAPNDPVWDDLTKAATAAQNTPQAWLDQRHLYGDIGQDTRFAESFGRWLNALYDQGVEPTLASYIQG